MQIGWDVLAVWQAERLGTPVQCLFIFLLIGGLIATQSWSFRISKRLFQKYRPAYGQHRKTNDVDEIVETLADGSGATVVKKEQ